MLLFLGNLVQCRTTLNNIAQPLTIIQQSFMLPILHNIKRIQYAESRYMRNVTLIHGKGVMLNVWRNLIDLPLVDLAQCEVTSKQENKTRLFTTTITARLSQHIDLRDKTYVFLITCVDGSVFMVGSCESPYPVVNTSDAFPGKTTDPSGCTLTVEYTDSLGLLRVLDV